MFWKKKRPIKIRVALDSIIYAPLYVFVQENSLDHKADFRFYIEPVHQRIKRVPEAYLANTIYHNLLSLGPISEDPVFSPVCDSSRFDEEPRTWFGVGDPLRARRLQISPGSAMSYKFVGTLISQLALWIIVEKNIQLEPKNLTKFNYVTCHSRGMTGYYVAEALFKTDCNDPLAPVYEPGREVEQVFNFLRQDWPRRSKAEDGDPVWAASVSTEIGKMLNMKKCHKKRTVIEPLHKTIGSGKIPRDFLLTALVAREDTENAQEIEDSSKTLKEGISTAIGKLDTDEFRRTLAAFYRSRASFALPGRNNPFFLEDHMKDLNILRRLKGLYPQNLCAPKTSKEGTERLLREAIERDFKPGTVTPPVSAIFDEIGPDTWDGDNLLWSS